MDNRNVVKKDLLRRKIKEYFEKNPNAKSVIVKANVGELKTIWKVTKESKRFDVVEVNTLREEFTIEQDDKDKEKKPSSEKKPEKKSDTEKTGVGMKSPVYQPDAEHAEPPKVGPTGTQAPGAEPKTPTWMKKAIASRGDPTDPTIPAQPTGQWDPNNPQGAFQRLAKSVGPLKAMLNMPDADLRRHFGLTKQALTQSLQAQQRGAKRAKQLGMKPFGQKNESKKLTEASIEYTNISKAFLDAMSDLSDHGKLSKTLRDANNAVGRITDPTEKQNLGAMIGALTGAVDVTTAGGGGPKPLARITPVKKTVAQLKQSKELAGRLIKEEDEEKDKVKKKDSQPEEPKEPVEEPESDFPEPEKVTEPRRSEEQVVLKKSLEGQTLKTADIELTPNGGILTLNFVALSIPAKLEWDNKGKVVYYFKDRPYLLRK